MRCIRACVPWLRLWRVGVPHAIGVRAVALGARCVPRRGAPEGPEMHGESMPMGATARALVLQCTFNRLGSGRRCACGSATLGRRRVPRGMLHVRWCL